MKLSKEFKLGLFIIIIIGLTFVVLNVLRGTDILGREKTVIGISTMSRASKVQRRYI